MKSLLPSRLTGRLIHFFVTFTFFMSLFIIFPMHPVHAQTVTFTVSGSWTVPAFVSSAVFEAWGGGGAGGGATTKSNGGGGGAGGQYAKKTYTVSAGQSYTVTVAGTTAGSTGNGGAGGDSGVVDPLSTQVVLAKGGAGGAANNGAGGTGSTSGGLGDTVFAGGSGAIGSATGGGGGGGGAGSGGAGGNASGQTGGTGTALNGGSGANGPTVKSSGVNGNDYGGGGSGGNLTSGGNVSGGTGAAGYATITYTPNSPPAFPTLISPGPGASGVALTPQFTLRTTDADNDYLQYEIYLYQSDCSTLVTGLTNPIAQASSQIGWSGQDANGGTAYVGSSTLASSTIAAYTYQGSLSFNTTYCWKADSVDPNGTNSYGTTSSTQLFTTMAAPSTDLFMRGGEYFSGGSKQKFYWAQ